MKDSKHHKAKRLREKQILSGMTVSQIQERKEKIRARVLRREDHIRTVSAEAKRRRNIAA